MSFLDRAWRRRISSGALQLQPISLCRVDFSFQGKAILRISRLYYRMFTLSLFPVNHAPFSDKTIRARKNKSVEQLLRLG